VIHSVEASPATTQRLAGAGGAPGAIRTRPRSIVTRALLSLSLSLSLPLALALAVLTVFPALAHAGSSWCGQPVVCDGSATLANGQQRINQGDYEQAITIFTCVIAADPVSVDAYRGRIEANLLLDRYSDAVRDYARVTAVVLPAHPDADLTILASYDARLASNPWDVPALTGASFARWWFFDYAGALPLLNKLLAVQPFDLYGQLFKGSTRLFLGQQGAAGKSNLALAILMAPYSAHVRFIVADAYTYAQPDPVRAFAEGTRALQWGLDTPRVHAILASAQFALGDESAAADHLQQHIDLVTTETVDTAALAVGGEVTLDLVPGRTFEIPIQAMVGQKINIETASPSEEISDSILVLLGPDGSPAAGNDDYIDYFAGLDWAAPETGTYTLQVTSFESVGTGQLVVTRN